MLRVGQSQYCTVKDHIHAYAAPQSNLDLMKAHEAQVYFDICSMLGLCEPKLAGGKNTNTLARDVHLRFMNSCITF